MNVTDLMNKQWEDLSVVIKSNTDEIFMPGVYIIAYSEKELKGNKINPEDIFYVGMTVSLSGMKGRLLQFFHSTEGKDEHSGGTRMFRTYLNSIPHSKSTNKKNLFVAFLLNPCTVDKKERKAEDLRKMGEVVKFEYDVLAYIKEKTGKEPELNKK